MVGGCRLVVVVFWLMIVYCLFVVCVLLCWCLRNPGFRSFVLSLVNVFACLSVVIVLLVLRCSSLSAPLFVWFVLFVLCAMLC